MPESTPTEQPRDFSTPDTHVCEVARFDNDGHLADCIALGELQEARPDNPVTGVITNITAHTDAE